MANSIADLINARLNTAEKSNVVSAVNEVNTKATGHTENSSIHVTGDEKNKIALIKDGTTSAKGLVQLSDAVNSTSTVLAATANAVKKSYDLANGKYAKPSTGIPKSDLASDVQASLSKADAAAIHQNDYEYQTPTIVGAQIRLTKQPNVNRLFFKLNNALSGNITISTDGGATSKNLVDLDGVQVTSLDKGFAEVVAEANFFILRNRGLSSSDMQALISIVNETEANESVLRSNFINSIKTVSTERIINLPDSASWNDTLLQIPNIKTGKGFASGSFKPGSSTYKVTGIPFTPSIVFIKTIQSSNVFLHVRWGVYGQSGFQNSFGNNMTSVYISSINADGFDFYSGQYLNNTFDWYAFE